MGKYVAMFLIIAAVAYIGHLTVTGDGTTSLKTGITGVTTSVNDDLKDLADD